MITPYVLNRAIEIQHEFQNALPFRHVCIDGFLDDDKCTALLRDFPSFEEKYAKNEMGEIGNKAVVERVTGISPFYSSFYQYINSHKFLDAISEMTGIPELLADETLFGGGTHENREPQGLDVHVDFNIDERKMLHRRVNLLIYLNPEWEDSWGGLIQLHSNPRTPAANEVKSFAPIFNRAVIFETNEYSWHGFERIVLPQEKKHLSRKSFSIYLYTKDRPANEVVAPHTTFYVARPLPVKIREGHTLTSDDVRELNILMASRDGLLHMYQDLLIAKEQRLIDFMGQVQDKVVDLVKRLRACPVCERGGDRNTSLGRLPTTVATRLELTAYDFVQCAGCDLVYLSPEPSQADLNSMYTETVQFADTTYTDAARISAIDTYIGECLARMLSHAGKPNDHQISVLEVGAGFAWMCRAAKSKQPASSTTAQDVSSEVAAQCPWVDEYVVGDVFNDRIGELGKFDLISLTHVIEHLADPVGVIKRCLTLLKPGGIIFITAPHRPIGWGPRDRSIDLWKRYPYNHIPAHIQYFSKQSMEVLAENVEAHLAYWNSSHEDGQAFEAWLKK